MTFLMLIIMAGFMLFINLRSPANQFNKVVSYCGMWLFLVLAGYVAIYQLFPIGGLK